MKEDKRVSQKLLQFDYKINRSSQLHSAAINNTIAEKKNYHRKLEEAVYENEARYIDENSHIGNYALSKNFIETMDVEECNRQIRNMKDYVIMK